MARPSKRERRRTPLRCNACGNLFQGPVTWVSMETTDRGNVGWAPEKGGEAGNKCPRCGSMAVGVDHD